MVVFNVCVANESKYSEPVIEHEEHSWNYENHFRNFQIVARMDRHCRFEKANDVVADVADRAADEMWSIARSHKLESGKRFLKSDQGIALAIRTAERDQRVKSNERESPEFLIALRRFKKKTWLA